MRDYQGRRIIEAECRERPLYIINGGQQFRSATIIVEIQPTAEREGKTSHTLLFVRHPSQEQQLRCLLKEQIPKLVKLFTATPVSRVRLLKA